MACEVLYFWSCFAFVLLSLFVPFVLHNLYSVTCRTNRYVSGLPKLKTPFDSRTKSLRIKTRLFIEGKVALEKLAANKYDYSPLDRMLVHSRVIPNILLCLNSDRGYLFIHLGGGR